MLCRQFKEGELQEWRPEVEDGNVGLVFSNRYFTPCREDVNWLDMDFPQLVDPYPRRALTKLKSATLRHLEDNIVLYLHRESSDAL